MALALGFGDARSFPQSVCGAEPLLFRRMVRGWMQVEGLWLSRGPDEDVTDWGVLCAPARESSR